MNYEDLMQKLEEKIDNEYQKFIDKLKQCTPEEIITKAYEKVCKKEMVYKIKNKDYEISDLKVLLKSDDILEECYDEWLKSDGNINEILESAVDTRISFLVEDYEKNNKKKLRESR